MFDKVRIYIFTITFNNFISQKANAGKEIVITYSAKLNEGALSTKEETNTVYLEYSNNPYDTTSTGKTPDHIVYVYDFDIKIDKYAAGESGNVNLAGAKFVLYKEVNGDKKVDFDTMCDLIQLLANGETLDRAITTLAKKL